MKYRCNNCGYETFFKFGLCPECRHGIGEPVVEEEKKQIYKSKKEKEILKNRKYIKKKKLVSIKEVEKNDNNRRIKTGFKELDKVFGNGIMENSINLIYGTPGIGKSTLILQIINNISKKGLKCVYISGEENPAQIKERYSRLGLNGEFYIEDETNLLQIEENYKEVDFLIIDSIQTVYLPEAGERGGISQIKACTNFLMDLAKKKNKTILLIGQITKDNEMAGPRILEHLVDAVFKMDFYDEQGIYRYIKSNKNRFGNIGEISIYEMTEKGMKEIENPSLLFINNKEEKIGAAYSLMLDGNKPIFIEIQTLVIPAMNDKNYLQSIGINPKRLMQINATLLKYLNIETYLNHIFTSIRGGIKLKDKDTHIDLAIAASIISSMSSLKVKPNYLFIGEIGLTGEIIPAKNEKKLVEIGKKFGFDKIISYTTGYKKINNIYSIFTD